MTQKSTPLFRRIPLTLKMVLVVLIVGTVIWAIADFIQSQALRKILEKQFIETMSVEAMEGRKRFDDYIKFHYHSVKLLTTQKRFIDYLDHLDKNNWSEKKDVEIKYYTQPPPWFPDPSIVRTYIRSRFALLIDANKRVREAYQGRMDKLPDFLVKPKSLLYKLTQNQSFLTLYKDTPYLIASKSILGPDGKLKAILTLGSPIDDEFLTSSQGATTKQELVALITAVTPRILASNHPDLLPVGEEIDTLKDRFLIVQEEFFDYGNSDLLIKLATFIPKTEIESLVETILNKEKKARIISFAILILSFSLIMFYTTKQIQELTQHVVDFEKNKLGLKKSTTIKGDELQILKDRFHSLTEEVLLSHEIIKKESAQQTRIIVNSALDAVIAINAYDQITTWNPRAEIIFGWSSKEALGRKLSEMIIPLKYRQAHLNGLKHVIAKGEGPLLNKQFETVALHRDGHELPIELSVSFSKSEGNFIFSAFLRDITERKKMEEQLIQASKMESVGRLAGGVAHDYNNILCAIIGYAELTLDEIEEDNPIRKNIEAIFSSGKRAAILTQQLLAFSRKQIIQPQVLDLNTSIGYTLKILSKLIGEDIEIKILKDKELWFVKADPAQMEQIIINLAVNARDAMPKGGTLIIKTANIFLDEEYAKDHLTVKSGEYVTLAISDTGCGMSDEVKEHIFEPFFTTKVTGKSTGLGLATVFGIVKQNKGNITVYSRSGEGTTFKIYLPRTTEKTTAEKEVEELQTTIPHGTETILVVEDDNDLRKLSATELSSIGYKVFEADNGINAIKISNEYRGDIHLLLTDVVMPKMSGSELSKKIIMTRPSIKIIYMSGYSENAIAQRGVLEAGVNFLQKPITPHAVARAVRKVLDRK